MAKFNMVKDEEKREYSRYADVVFIHFIGHGFDLHYKKRPKDGLREELETLKNNNVIFDFNIENTPNFCKVMFEVSDGELTANLLTARDIVDSYFA